MGSELFRILRAAMLLKQHRGFYFDSSHESHVLESGSFPEERLLPEKICGAKIVAAKRTAIIASAQSKGRAAKQIFANSSPLIEFIHFFLKR